jgi:acetyl esterase
MARDKGGPAIFYQLLEISELDDRLDTPSMMAFQDTPFWNRPNAVWGWKH